jgi:hypothetical protein
VQRPGFDPECICNVTRKGNRSPGFAQLWNQAVEFRRRKPVNGHQPEPESPDAERREPTQHFCETWHGSSGHQNICVEHDIRVREILKALQNQIERSRPVRESVMRLGIRAKQRNRYLGYPAFDHMLGKLGVREAEPIRLDLYCAITDPT